MNTNADYQSYLKDELARRFENNSRYSVRSFAKALSVDAGTLSKILNGKQSLSFKMAARLIEKLSLNPSQQKKFLASVEKEQNNRELLRRGKPQGPKPKDYKGDDLSIDYYRVISDWYHLAIMEMTYIEGFQPNAIYISKKLGISRAEAKLALGRLLDLGLLEKQNGHLVKVADKLSTTDRHLTNTALRKNQKQFLEKSIHSLDNDPIEKRNHTNMTMAIDSSKMEIAKRMIREFQMSLCNFLEDGQRDNVYNMSISLYPLQEDKK